MRLDKAIKIFGLWVNNKPVIPASKLHVAARLLIEAGKRLIYDRQEKPYLRAETLPGETEEQCKYCGLTHTGIECPSREGEK